MGGKEIGAWVIKLATADLTDAERRAFTKVFFKMGWRTIVAMHILYACGWLVAFGLGGGFAKAEDVPKLIQQETQPLATAVAEMSAKLNQQIELNKKREARSLESDIRYLTAKLCATTAGAERDRLYREIDTKQEEFEALRGRRYTPPPCSEL